MIEARLINLFLVEAGFAKHPVISNSRDFLPAPAEYAYPSDQGKLFTCTRHALGKAIVDGFQKKIFWTLEVYDFSQKEVIEKLIQQYKNEEMEGKWPDLGKSLKLNNLLTLRGGNMYVIVRGGGPILTFFYLPKD